MKGMDQPAESELSPALGTEEATAPTAAGPVQHPSAGGGHSESGKAQAGWERRISSEPGWLREGEAQDVFTGRRLRERMGKYVTQRDNETPKQLVAQLPYAASLPALLEVNNARFFAGKLKASSKLKKNTKLLIPDTDGEPKRIIEGTVVAAREDYSLWMVRYDDGDVMDLVASEVREACWCFRVHHEGWSVSPDHPFVGALLRRTWPVDGKLYAVNGHIAGYLPPGDSAEDFALWHAMHDDGDDEDLEEAEVQEGIRCHSEWTCQQQQQQQQQQQPMPQRRRRRRRRQQENAEGETKEKKQKKATKTKQQQKRVEKGTASSRLGDDVPGRKRAAPETGCQGKNAASKKNKRESMERGTSSLKKRPSACSPLVQAASPQGEGGAAIYGGRCSDAHLSLGLQDTLRDGADSGDSADFDVGMKSSPEIELVDGEDNLAVYDSVWEDLTEGQKAAAQQLGYNQEQWSAEEVPPECVGSQWELDTDVVRCWEELSTEHRAAAATIGYDRWTWDQAMRDCVLPADNADVSMFALAEECFAFDAEGKPTGPTVLAMRLKLTLLTPAW
jgi:hypothetical protein